MQRFFIRFVLALALAAPATAAAQPTFQFEHPKSEEPEHTGTAFIWVRLSQVQSAATSVRFIVLNGTATRGTAPTPPVDYVLADGVVTFAPGETLKTIAVTIVDDREEEVTEDFVVLLHTPVGGQLGERTVHAFFVFDNDKSDFEAPSPPPPPPGPPPHEDPPPPPPPIVPPVVSFATATSSVPEKDPNTTIKVVLSREPTENVTVAYAVTGGTATSNQDYVLANGTLTFAPGVLERTFQVSITNDTRDELDETVLLALQSPSHATLGAAVHTLKIIDDDTVDVTFKQPTSQALENASVAGIELALSAQSDKEIVVGFVAGGTASGDQVDYAMPVTPVKFAPGQTSALLNIPIVNDALVEGDETIALTIVSASEARIGSASRHTHTIKDDDRVLPVVRFAARSSSDAELVPSATIDVVLEPAFSETVTVAFARTDGTASTADYTLAAGTLTFAPGEERKTIPIAFIDDLAEEADETIDITLSNPTNARLGDLSRHTRWILDDDAPATNIAFFRQAVPTADGFRKLVLIGSKTQTIVSAGLAIDESANLYVSNQGTTPNQGTILMSVPGRGDTAQTGLVEFLEIMKLSVTPGDIELSRDGRGLVIGAPNGTIVQKSFGISVKVTGISSAGPATRVYAQTDLGTTPAVSLSPDGYFHVPDILAPGQHSETVTIVIEHNGLTRTHQGVPLGQAAPPAEDGSTQPRRLVGQTVIQLQGPVKQ